MINETGIRDKLRITDLTPSQMGLFFREGKGDGRLKKTSELIE